MEVHILPTAQQDTENVGLLSYHWTVRTARKALSQLWCLALSTMTIRSACRKMVHMQLLALFSNSRFHAQIC